jgi:hypothetical protein
VCDLPSAGEDRRRLVPLYGAGIDAAGVRKNFGEWSDFEHCADASALAAAASAALKRSGGWDQNPVGSFASEGESFQALHQELLACAQRTFVEHTRDKRDPSSWTSAELSAGAADPATFINESRIGFPLHVQIPRRKLSWWFNAAMLELGILSEAGLSVTSVQSGFIQPSGC